MRKTFPLAHPKHAPARVIEAVKSDIRKYFKRERRKTPPEGIAHWDFDCRWGRDESDANAAHPAELVKAVDAAAAENWPAIYIEILAKPGRPSSVKPKSKDAVVADAESEPIAAAQP